MTTLTSDGREWTLSLGETFLRTGHCLTCSKPVAWVVLTGTVMALDPDGGLHMDSSTACRDAIRWQSAEIKKELPG